MDGPPHLLTETLSPSCARTAGKWFSPVPCVTQMKPQARAFSPIREENRKRRGLVGGAEGIRTSGTVCLTLRDGLLTVY